MFATIISGGLKGIRSFIVRVEVDMGNGLPGFSMVGSLSGEVKESRERVSVALRNVGFSLPPKKITVNLSPADERKEGTAYDLPIAVGILRTMELLNEDFTEDTLFLGELGLNGEVKSVRGVLPIVEEAARSGIKRCIIPFSNVREGSVVDNIQVIGIENIKDIFDEEKIKDFVKIDIKDLFAKNTCGGSNNFSQVKGQENAKRAALIAAAGFHNILLMGPPGAGKSMIAKRIPGIMPPLTLSESLEVTSICSVAGLMKENVFLVTERPFLAPHHSVSISAMTGGGKIPRPGIISLSHRGVLFLDEFPEFNRSVIECLRQPIEDKKIDISRVYGNVTYPTDFMLVCAMNPCPCGYFPDRNKCKCSESQIRKYINKISGPILDRIDLCVELEKVGVDALSGDGSTESDMELKNKVLRARDAQFDRYKHENFLFNSQLENEGLKKYCALEGKCKKLMEKLYDSLDLSARAYHRILKVGRTIADIEGCEKIEEKHLMEAASYRFVRGYENE